MAAGEGIADCLEGRFAVEPAGRDDGSGMRA